MLSHRVIIGNAMKMSELANNSVDLVVTSPPYWNIKEYGNGDKAKGYEEYLTLLRNVFGEVTRVLKPGRFACVNIGTALYQDMMTHIPSDFIKIMQELGFILKREIIWNKPLGTQGLWQDYTTKFLKKMPYPCYLNVNVVHEFIHIFQKPGDCGIAFIPENRLSESFIKEVCWSVWTMRVSYVKGHPAPFPDELVRRLVLCYSLKNELVLDCFGGSGTTMKVSRNLGRQAIIYEINQKYADLIKETVQFATQSLNNDQEYSLIIREDSIKTEAKVPKTNKPRKSTKKKGLDGFFS
jgi:modification methylase